MTTARIGRPPVGPRVVTHIPTETRDAITAMAQQDGVPFASALRDLIATHPAIKRATAERERLGRHPSPSVVAQ